MSTLGQTTLTRLDERVGVDISSSASYEEVMRDAGFDFDVEKTPVHDIEGREIPGHFNIRRNDTKQTLPCAALLNGEYGFKKVYAGVPVVVGNNGVEKIEEIELNEKERNEFNHSVEAVKKLWDVATTIDPDLK